MNRTAAIAGVLAAPLLLSTACNRNDVRPDERDRSAEDQPLFEQTAREESLDEQEPGVQAHGVDLNEREPVAGRDEPSGATNPYDRASTKTPVGVSLQTAPGVDLEGKARFTETEQGVEVVLQLENAPAGKHGVHIHEKGDCSNIEGESMGGHFAPKGDQHALPNEKPQSARHLGDLGNIEVGRDGKGKLSFTVPEATLSPEQTTSFLGKAIVVHEGKDHGVEKQPSGGSGTPIACAVIERR